MSASAIHLVRHGEVFNPTGVLYGRIEGFGLSELGTRMAAKSAESFAGRDVRRIVASPLQRTRESAAPWSTGFGLDVDIDERIIEPWNRFEGTKVRFGPGVLGKPEVWQWVRNPFLPSWGEPYVEIANRMMAAIDEAYESVDGGEVVLVSHQLPIWMVHRHLAAERLYHDPRRRRCSLSSITSLTKRDGTFVETGYSNPAASLAIAATDTGAV
ncbi:histidine phosphatase family protein [Amnibacterium flavum]|uniref:Histidine phosphatase family protein n=1 Tax=Amnibacterium flavum TaxID=2173173 RepID=A0A2V1HSM9_9MICO|nr:histidine phosphatase family protein [Amnibacterium flavum]PVZ95593.1 histidine phosphatase family protein [Amnibacterium flavum]